MPGAVVGWEPGNVPGFPLQVIPTGSILVVSGLLAASFSSQRFLDSAFLPGFQVEGVFLDLLDDVFLLNLALETSKRAF